MYMFQGDFHFAKVFGKHNEDAEERKQRGHKMLTVLSGGNQFCIVDMLGILRDKESNICRGVDHPNPTASSQVTTDLIACTFSLSSLWLHYVFFSFSFFSSSRVYFIL